MLTPEYFQKCKNLFILFHYGLGGNHLGNLLSLHPKFSPRFQIDSNVTYESKVVAEYNSPRRFERYKTRDGNRQIVFNVHPDPERINLDILNHQLTKELLEHTNKVNILTGHWHGFDKQYRLGNFAKLTNHCWIIIQPPTIKKELHLRLPDHCTTTPGDIEKYSYPFDFSKPDINEDNHCFLDTDKFVTENGVAYLNERLTEHLGIELPNSARTLHSMWLENIDKAAKLVKYSL